MTNKKCNCSFSGTEHCPTHGKDFCKNPRWTTNWAGKTIFKCGSKGHKHD